MSQTATVRKSESPKSACVTNVASQHFTSAAQHINIKKDAAK